MAKWFIGPDKKWKLLCQSGTKWQLGNAGDPCGCGGAVCANCIGGGPAIFTASFFGVEHFTSCIMGTAVSGHLVSESFNTQYALNNQAPSQPCLWRADPATSIYDFYTASSNCTGAHNTGPFGPVIELRVNNNFTLTRISIAVTELNSGTLFFAFQDFPNEVGQKIDCRKTFTLQNRNTSFNPPGTIGRNGSVTIVGAGLLNVLP